MAAFNVFIIRLEIDKCVKTSFIMRPRMLRTMASTGFDIWKVILVTFHSR